MNLLKLLVDNVKTRTSEIIAQSGMDRKTSLQELRVISFSMGRQTGRTNSINTIFNPGDFYICNSDPAMPGFSLWRYETCLELLADIDAQLRVSNADKDSVNKVIYFDLGTYEALTKYNDWVIAIINHIEQRTTGLPIYVIL